jgi:hypothetical protein
MLNKVQIQKYVQNKTDLQIIKFLKGKLKDFEKTTKEHLENKKEIKSKDVNLRLKEAKDQKEIE